MILFVEPSYRHLELATEFLEARNCHLITAGSAEELLHTIVHNGGTIDTIIYDPENIILDKDLCDMFEFIQKYCPGDYVFVEWNLVSELAHKSHYECDEAA